MMKANTVQQVRELTTPFKPNSMKTTTKADVMFMISDDLTALCDNYGQVVTPGLLDLSNCHITGKVADVVQVGEQATANFQAFDFIGKPYEQLIASESLDCELVSEIVGTIAASCSVERRGEGRYEISYQPTVKGRHQLHIKVEGQHIRESPFNMAVRSPIENLGVPMMLSINETAGPKGVVINKKGELLVTEGEGHCVSVFSPSGEKLRSFGETGVGTHSRGHLQAPGGVAVDDVGNILVVDSRKPCIQKFTAEGRYLTTKVFYSNEPLQCTCPVDIAFNASNKRIYVADMNNHRIQVLNSDLTFSSTIGRRGNGKGQFSSPCSVACDSTGKVYVADAQNHRIQVFGTEGSGKHLRVFGRRGLGSGELDTPAGVVVDVSGVVYVSEAGNHRVSVFTSEGQFVTSFGHQGEGPGEFNYPRGLAVDNSGVVYVCDYRNNSVKIF